MGRRSFCLAGSSVSPNGISRRRRQKQFWTGSHNLPSGGNRHRERHHRTRDSKQCRRYARSHQDNGCSCVRRVVVFTGVDYQLSSIHKRQLHSILSHVDSLFLIFVSLVCGLRSGDSEEWFRNLLNVQKMPPNNRGSKINQSRIHREGLSNFIRSCVSYCYSYLNACLDTHIRTLILSTVGFSLLHLCFRLPENKPWTDNSTANKDNHILSTHTIDNSFFPLVRFLYSHKQFLLDISTFHPLLISIFFHKSHSIRTPSINSISLYSPHY